MAVIIYVMFVKDNWADWTGFDGKTLWEWLELLGVPIALAVLGIIFQQQEQKRSREEAKEQREISADKAKDEVLQAYFDRLSVLLVDKNLLAIAARLYSKDETQNDGDQDNKLSAEQQELFYVAVDIIRARTLSILRRFQKDGKRKASVIRFLIESEVIGKAKLSLSFADLSDAKLGGVYLVRAYLTKG